MAARKAKTDRDVVLCLRVKLKQGTKLSKKIFGSPSPYCKVWVGPKGQIEPPEKGYYYSTVFDGSNNPFWGNPSLSKPDLNESTKSLYKKVGSQFMVPLDEIKQDQWTFLWKEGHVIHCQCWDRSSNDYMGNVSFEPDIKKTGTVSMTADVHNGPPGQQRSKEKVSGQISIEWEWATKTDQLKVDKWLPLLQKLTFGDDRALSFIRQEDLIPYMSLPAARFILGKIAKGEIEFPAENVSFGAQMPARNDKSKRLTIQTTAADWEMDFADDNDDDDAREPEGIVFFNLGTKVIQIDYYEGETTGDIKQRMGGVSGVDPAALTFTDYQGFTVPNTEPMVTFASLTLTVTTSQRSVEEIAVAYQKLAAGELDAQAALRAGPSSHQSKQPMTANQVIGQLATEVPGYKMRRAATVAFPSPSANKSGPTLGPNGAPVKPARIHAAGLITLLAKMLFKEDYDGMARTLCNLNMDKLTTTTPILVACQHPAVLQLIKTKGEENEAFANRIRMIQNTRSQFSHLDPIVGHLKLSTFLDTFLDPNLSFNQGQEWNMESLHPLTNKPIDHVKVVKIFSSLARPSILSLSYKGEPQPPGVLFKRGEDLYSETCLQVLFTYMNEIWEKNLPIDIRPRIFGLRELPGSTERGFLEIVPEVRDLEVVERGDMELITPESDENFIRTTCGWVLAAYFLGLSDRHRENTLVRITDGSAIPIDFGFILGNEPPSYNTFCITVSRDMYKYLIRKDKWEWFCLLFLAGFWAVRCFAQEFIRLAVHLFQGTDRNLEVSARFITYRMMLGKDFNRCMKQIYNNLRHAPICFFTVKKIEGHCKAKKIPAREDMIGSLARKIGANAAKPSKAETTTGGQAGDSLHPGKVDLNLPAVYPDHYPGELVALLHALPVKNKK